MASSKPQISCQKLSITSILFLSVLLMLMLFSFNPNRAPSSTITSNSSPEPIKIGLVNVDDHVKHAYDRMHGQLETVTVDFRRVSEELKWESFFPEWIDEDARWHQPSCPEVPMPRLEDYGDLDVILARVPCGSGSEKEGMRTDQWIDQGWWRSDGVRYFHGSCGPMQEIFRCDDLMTRLGGYWVYKPELRRLRQKVQMPVGSCQIAPLDRFTGMVAYATVIHSSEAYVCGAIALAQSIIQKNSTRDLVLLHDSSLSPQSLVGLRSAGWKTKLIQPIRSPFARKNSYNEWNYSKLRLWQLTDYDKVIFIDADLIVLRNIDKFFAYPQLSAAPNDGVLFNSGIMVIEPSTCLFEEMMSKRDKLFSYNGGDQGFLNEVFTWWHRLPTRLNYLKIFKEQGNPDHEIQKDYDCNWDMLDRHVFASDSAHRRWWRVYDAMPRKLQKYCGLTKHMDARIRKWRGKAKNANLPDGHWKINVKDPRQNHLNN
ncbi:UDP-glucuronate:xylan alpha-glucuronosyltransferase [Salix suchowensis]|nr:UDP-glucuronate:xylan alpha-glucuronosyltransferase [Salix suchowensis]